MKTYPNGSPKPRALAPAPPELERARTVVQQAESDAYVQSNAALELKNASDALNRAIALQARGESLAEVSSAAYVAERHARAAMAVAQAKRNEAAITAAEGDRERARADGKELEARRAQSQAASAQAQAQTAQAQAAAAQGQAQAAQQRANSAEVRADAAQAVASDAQQRAAMLQQQLNDLQAKETERGMLVTLGDVLFEFNRAEVKPAAQVSLRKLADFLLQYPNRLLLVEGHTDNVGSVAYNEGLSQRRAESVGLALVAMGIAPQRIKVVGYGKDYPIADNNSDTNRALNRRVEVYISQSEQPVRMRR